MSHRRIQMKRIPLNVAEEGKKYEGKNDCSTEIKPGGQQQILTIIRNLLFQPCKEREKQNLNFPVGKEFKRCIFNDECWIINLVEKS